MTDIHSNDGLCAKSAPATLATEKHGGCVQLSSCTLETNLRDRAIGCTEEGLHGTAEFLLEAAAALSAQPSKALKTGGIAVYSILRDWVKGQVTAIEIGMLTFEAAFLSHILLPSGATVIEHVQQQKLLLQERARD